MLTAQSQKADYYHPESLLRPYETRGKAGGSSWQTTQPINFFPEAHDLIRALTRTAVRLAAECHRVPDISQPQSLLPWFFSSDSGGFCSGVETRLHGYRPDW